MPEKPEIPLSRQEVKEALKEALREWLEAKVAQFGWYSLRGLFALALVAMVYVALAWHGWKPPS